MSHTIAERKLLADNKDKLIIIAESLLEREVLSGPDITKIVNNEPLAPKAPEPVKDIKPDKNEAEIADETEKSDVIQINDIDIAGETE